MPDPISAYFARRRPSARELQLSGHIKVASAYAEDVSRIYVTAPPGVPAIVPVRTWAEDVNGNLILDADGNPVQAGFQNITMTHEQAWATQHGLNDHTQSLKTLRNAEEWYRKHG
jgi:hypothetical protein